MTGEHIDHRMSLAARLLAILAAVVALGGLLNVSRCPNQTAATTLAAASPSATAAIPALPETEAGSATVAYPATRRLAPTLISIPVDDVPEGFDRLATGTSRE